MSITKPTGKRQRKRILPPKQRREKRAAQAARAILAGRGDRDANWSRVARCFSDYGSAEAAVTFAHTLGLATVPAHLLEKAFPPEPAADDTFVGLAGALGLLDDPGEPSVWDEGHPQDEPEPVDTQTEPLFPEEAPSPADQGALAALAEVPA